MKSTRLAAVIGAAAITAAGLAALAGCGTTTKAPAAATTPATAATPAASATPGGSAYAYYQTMMGRLYGSGSMFTATLFIRDTVYYRIYNLHFVSASELYIRNFLSSVFG